MSIARHHWSQLLDLVEQALYQPAPERERWLTELTIDQALKACLRGLLEERRAIETGDFLQVMPTLSDPSPKPAAFTPGSRMGPWRLVRLLGEGGMSAVWLAERADEQVQRQVALKLPHAGPGQDVLAARLLQERNILAGLEHRNIARLYDVGVSDQGLPFLVMEFVQGQTLLEHADVQCLTVQQRLALFQQVLRAVQYAHGKLVLHRDLKPSNILVNEAGDVKLLDFGIAKVMDSTDNRPDASELTQAFGHRLTPSYASPEQLRGESLGTASDVYSLGVVLYELLCGVRPFGATRHAAHSAQQDVKAPSHIHLSASTLAARSSSTLQWRKALQGDLDAIVLKSLHDRPQERYATADALALDVAHYLASEPVSATPPSKWYSVTKFITRHRLGVGLSSAAAALLLVSSGLALVQSQRASEEARRATAAKEFLLSLFAGANVEAQGGRQLSAQDLLQRGRQTIEQNLKGQPLLQAELLTGISHAQRDNNDLLGADDSLQAAIIHWQALGQNEAVLEATLARANIAMHQRRYELAAQLAATAQALSNSAQANDLSRRLLNLQANLAMAQLDFAAAQRYFERYLNAVGNTPSVDNEELTFALLTMADLSSRQQQHDAATRYLERARRTAGPKPAPQLEVDILIYAASTDMNVGHYAHLRQGLPADLQRCEALLGPQSRRCWRLRSTLVATLLKLGYVESAVVHIPWLQGMAEQDKAPERQAQSEIMLTRLAAAQALGSASARQRISSLTERWRNTGHQLPLVIQRQVLNTLAEAELLQGQTAAGKQWADAAQALSASTDDKAEQFKTTLFQGVALSQLHRPEDALSALGPLCQTLAGPSGMSPVLAHLFSLNCVAPLRAVGQDATAQRLLATALATLVSTMGPDSPTTLRAQALLSPPQPSQQAWPPMFF